MHMLTVLYTGYNGYTIYETGTKNWSIEIFQLSQFMLAMTFKHIFYKKIPIYFLLICIMLIFFRMSYPY